MNSYICPTSELYTMQFSERDITQLARFFEGIINHFESRRDIPNVSAQSLQLSDSIRQEATRRRRARERAGVEDVEDDNPAFPFEPNRIPDPPAQAPRVRPAGRFATATQDPGVERVLRQARMAERERDGFGAQHDRDREE